MSNDLLTDETTGSIITAEPQTKGEVQDRAVSGAKALGMRTVMSLLLRVISALCLARLLFPDDYGVFGVAAYITSLGAYLTDVGLGAALVREEQAPTDDELTTSFLCQQALAATVVLLIIGTTPLLIEAYHLSSAATLLLMTMTIGLFFSSLRMVPMLVLERTLRFDVIARCEMIENLVQTFSTIGLALLHCGPWALAGGGILRGLVGLVLIWQASPWRPRGRFDIQIALRLARFGIPFQVAAILPALLGGWVPLVVGRVVSIAAVGLVNWALNISSVPQMFSEVVGRISFPAFSRMSTEPEGVGRVLIASVRRINAILALAIPLIILLCPVFVPLLFSTKWSPAIPLVQWFSAEVFLTTNMRLLAASQSASGRATERMFVAGAIGIFRIVVGVSCVVHFGLPGLGPALLFVTVCEYLLTLELSRRRTPGCENIFGQLLPPLCMVAAITVVSLLVGLLIAPNGLRSVVSLAAFLLLIFLQEFAMKTRPLSQELKAVFRMLRSAPPRAAS